jgi:phosphoglycerate-specific signal transduction histidine kinase
MRIEDRYIADARERLRKKAQNEATCFALNDMRKDAQDEVSRLREENERLRENAKTISELEQLAARSNNDLLVENERLRKDADRLDWLLSDFGMRYSAVFRAWDGWSDLRPVIDAARGGK